MPKGQLQIHTENLLPIIKRWLYSDKEIFIRELVSNACDAINKLHIIKDRGLTPTELQAPRIDIQIDSDKKTITISDSGIGMTKEEVEKYIAQVAFSGAEDFLKKYTTSNEKDQIIGHFGLGFYSAYMAASKVDIQTLSYAEGSDPVFWSCDGSSAYEIDTGSRTTHGTDIILHIQEDSTEFLELDTLKKILTKYCSYLPFPIYLNQERINPNEPLWLKPASECTKEEYIQFFHQLYPEEYQDPLFWVHINVDYPFNLRGILYFTRLDRQYDPNKNYIRLYCNRVYVSDHCQEILPQYLASMRGAIDSPDIPLNVSRSSLQMDKTVRQLSSHISKKVADKLNTLYTQDRDSYCQSWEDIGIIVKIGAIQDEKFYNNVKNALIWPTLDKKWISADDYISKNSEAYNKKVYYALNSRDQSHLESVYLEKNIDVLVMSDMVDTSMVGFLEQKFPEVKFCRIDGDLHDILLDPTKEDGASDDSGKTITATILELASGAFGSESKMKFEAKSVASDNIPGFVVIEEQMRRMREYLARMNPEFLKTNPLGQDNQTLVLNTNHPMVRSLPTIANIDPQLADAMVHHIYDLALIAQNEMRDDRFQAFLKRDQDLMSKLAQRFCQEYSAS
jgi:molecular chaperone HtpG